MGSAVVQWSRRWRECVGQRRKKERSQGPRAKGMNERIDTRGAVLEWNSIFSQSIEKQRMPRPFKSLSRALEWSVRWRMTWAQGGTGAQGPMNLGKRGGETWWRIAAWAPLRPPGESQQTNMVKRDCRLLIGCSSEKCLPIPGFRFPSAAIHAFCS